MVVMDVFVELEKAGFSPVLYRDWGILTITNIYLHDTAEQTALLNTLTSYIGFCGVNESDDDIHYVFSADPEMFRVVARWKRAE